MNLVEISNRFPTEQDCVLFFEKTRWGKTPKCSHCNSTQVSLLQKDLRRKCKSCNRSFSVTSNTFLHNTRLPLKTWLYSFAVITDSKKGISALQLQRNLGVHYETAFNMYHKIRLIMEHQNKKNSEFEGIVEMDETYIGGKPIKQSDFGCFPQKKREELDVRIKELKEAGVTFRGSNKTTKKCAVEPKRCRGTNNIPVVGIVERNGDKVAEVMRTLTYENLKSMVQKYVNEDKSVLITDEYRGYSKMKNIIEHVKIDHKKIYSYRGINTNSIESFWAIIERGIMGQYHSVSIKYLPNYVAEFVYKYNNRKDNEVMFYELVKKSIKTNSNASKPINR